MKNAVQLLQKLLPVILTLGCTLILTKANAYDIVVAKDGSGNYTTVQAAINATPTNLSIPFTIFIRNGKYREKISIPSNKPFIQMIGESVANVFIYYDDPAIILGTQNSASFSIGAADFSAFNITFANTYGDGSQAVAVLVNADRVVFKNCRFFGNQDTLYTKGGSPGKCYFLNCYIDGNVDFIFGSSIAVFDSCVVYAKSRTNAGSSFITAANTPTGQSYGYVFRNTRFPANTGATNYFLGRPWPSPSVAATAQKTVLINCKLNPFIQPAGWTIWDANTITSNIYYGEFESRYFNNNLVDISQRVPWSYQLNSTEAASYTLSNIFGAWDPCSVYSGFCNTGSTDIAVSNFRATKGASTSPINWNISWPITGIRYQLFRSSDNINFSQIDDITATTDTAVNFQSTDVVPPAGNIYYYYLVASKTGYASHTSDTVQVSSKPTITTSSALGTFTQGLGSPSAAQVYTVSAVNMIDNLSIRPPLEYEVSANAGASWFTNSSPLILVPVGNTITSTNISVRLNASSLGTYSGNIEHTSTGADPVNIAVTGITSATAPVPSVVLQMWPFTQNNGDSAALRSAALVSSTPVFNFMTNSNGLVSPATGNAIPPYSTNFGQASSPTADGLWGTATGGPGGTLNRKNWQQFIITASDGNTVKLDSVLLNAAFVSTASNIKMGLVFSRNGFSSPADSTEFHAGYGGQPAGALVLTTSGTFLKSFPIAQQNTGPITPLVHNYRLALTSGAGITLLPGESLSIRIYFACGSSTGGKYITIRDFTVKGAVLTIVPVQLLSFNARKLNGAASLNWKSTNEVNLEKYIIEKSTGGGNFYSIGEIQANNAAGVNTYNFSDMSFGLTSLYRLHIIDRDGKESLSNIIKLDTKAPTIISIFPNPAPKQVTVSYEKLNGNTMLEIYSLKGDRVISKQLINGSTQTVISIADLAAGTYLVKFTGREESTAQFIINR